MEAEAWTALEGDRLSGFLPGARSVVSLQGPINLLVSKTEK